MKAFIDLIQRTRLKAQVYHNAMVCGNWQLKESHLGVCCFHMVTLGECWLTVNDHKVLLKEGDLVFFPREIPHQVFPTKPQEGAQQHLPYAEVGPNEGTGLLCGEIKFEHPVAEQLLTALPPYFIVPAAGNACWFKPLYDLILIECRSPSMASSLVLDRLSELVFMHAVQFALEEVGANLSFLALYGHPMLGPVIAAIHEQPQRPWALESLAKLAGVSRTQFAKLFKAISGWTPMQYITWWRMQLAVDLLRKGESFSRICDAIGYQSEAAFQRTFKQVIGESPGKFRKR